MQISTTSTTDFYYMSFINSLKTKVTKQDYTLRIKYFMNYIGATKWSELIENKDQKTIENQIKSYLVYLRQEKGLSHESAVHYFNPLRKFYYVNSDYNFKWDLIKQYLGNDEDEENIIKVVEDEPDRPYTRDEIKQMLNSAPDIRVKIIILLMSSSGMRVGSIPLLKIRDLQRWDKYNLFTINVYGRSKKSNYQTFCTPECASMIDTYLNYRVHCGETLKPDTPLLREQFNPADKFKVSNPKHISRGLVKYLVNEVLTKYSTLKDKIEYDYENKRKKAKHSTMLTHALRKYFDTESRKAGVYPDIVELLMGHRLPGIRSHYFKLDLQTKFYGTNDMQGYEKAINQLTINDEHRLKIENQDLKKQVKDFHINLGLRVDEYLKNKGIT